MHLKCCFGQQYSCDILHLKGGYGLTFQPFTKKLQVFTNIMADTGVSDRSQFKRYLGLGPWLGGILKLPATYGRLALEWSYLNIWSDKSEVSTQVLKATYDRNMGRQNALRLSWHNWQSHQEAVVAVHHYF